MPGETKNTMECRSQETCPLCGAGGVVLAVDLTDRIFGCVDGVWRMRRCGNAACGTLWLDPRPLEAELGKAYAVYFTHGKSRRAAADQATARPWLRILVRLADGFFKRWHGVKAARRRHNLLGLPTGKGRRLLEVGCGGGKRLGLFRKHGWLVEGQDVDAAAVRQAQSAQGVPVHHGDLLHGLELPVGAYDAIVMNHVLEHVYDPVALLRVCHGLLAPGGILAMATPNALSFGLREFGRDWMGLDVPRHLQVFTSSALAETARRAGFGRVKTWTEAAAKASSFGIISLSLRRPGRFDMAAGPAPDLEWEALRFQARALAEFRRDPASGEELVLHAWKT